VTLPCELHAPSWSRLHTFDVVTCRGGARDRHTHELTHTCSHAQAASILKGLAAKHGLDIAGGKIRRTSSRFCLGVEHGDYNGTELFGVGTDRFIWMGFKPNGTDKVRLVSANFPEEAVVEFKVGDVPPPLTPNVMDKWARFPFGVDYVLNKEGFKTSTGFDAVLYGNIPGGGMSRSASLCINLLVTMMEVNGHSLPAGEDFRMIELSQAVENIYIGSPCGQLDQIMIYFSKEGMGTHFNPATNEIKYVPLGDGCDFRIVAMDTGTDRPGLDKSTYKVRRQECDDFAAMLAARSDLPGVNRLGDVKTEEQYNQIKALYGGSHPHLVDRLSYIYKANKRFYEMLEAWRQGDVEKIGAVFREDGHGLRSEYVISGPELETMCDIVRTVPGCVGERMLGGGDKGAAGALIHPEAEAQLRQAVDVAYPRCHPDYKDKYAVHVVKSCAGVKDIEGML
jgi:galactokinase